MANNKNEIDMTPVSTVGMTPAGVSKKDKGTIEFITEKKRQMKESQYRKNFDAL